MGSVSMTFPGFLLSGISSLRICTGNISIFDVLLPLPGDVMPEERFLPEYTLPEDKGERSEFAVAARWRDFGWLCFLWPRLRDFLTTVRFGDWPL